MPKEKRAEKRFLLAVPLVYAGDRFQGNSQTIDISRSGLRFTIYHPIREGDLLGLEIYPREGRKPLELNSEVRWRRSFADRPHHEVGTKFMMAKPSERRRLARLIKKAPGTLSQKL